MEMNYDINIKFILSEAFNNRVNGNDDRDGLTYVDVFYPKIEVLIGVDEVIKVLEGSKTVAEAFVSSGLDSADYESIGRTISYGMDAWQKEPTEERLSEITKISDSLISGYVDKVRHHIISNPGSGITVDEFDQKINELFTTRMNVFKDLSINLDESAKKM